METMDLQKITFFTEGNTFTGSKTKDPQAGMMLRYRVCPDKENGRLAACCWDTDVCYEKAGETREADFPLSEDGLEQVRAWLLNQFEALGAGRQEE